MDPFRDSRVIAEQVALSSMQIFLNYYATLGKKAVRYDQIRPHALYSAKTASIRVPVPSVTVLEKEYKLNQHVDVVDPKIDVHKLPLNRNRPLDLVEGGVVHGCDNQCDWDHLVLVSGAKLAIIGQVKTCLLLDEKTGRPPSSSPLEVSFVAEQSKKVQEIASQHKEVIMEFISTRRLSNQKYVPEDYVCIVHQGNWSRVMGPLFGHINPYLQSATNKIVFLISTLRV